MWRSGASVVRTAGPWTTTVHAFLNYLEAVGFDGSPRVVGTDAEGREVLTFIEGEVLADPDWEPGNPSPWPVWAQTDECLASAARLLREFHDAADGFTPPPEAVWRQHPSSALGPKEIVCHGDIGTHNTVFRNGIAVAFIDWDAIRPNDPLIEFGRALWKFVPLGDERYFAASDFTAPPDLARRVELFARTYGVHQAEAVRWSLQQAMQRSVEEAKYWPISASEAAAALRRVAESLDWLAAHESMLVTMLD